MCRRIYASLGLNELTQPVTPFGATDHGQLWPDGIKPPPELIFTYKRWGSISIARKELEIYVYKISPKSPRHMFGNIRWLNLMYLFQIIRDSFLGLDINRFSHWGRVTHICVSELTIIGSDNGLSPERRQAIIWNSAGILLIGPLGTYFSEISIKIHIFSFKKMHLKVSSGKWRPFCLGLNVLTTSARITSSTLRQSYDCPACLKQPCRIWVKLSH